MSSRKQVKCNLCIVKGGLFWENKSFDNDEEYLTHLDEKHNIRIMKESGHGKENQTTEKS